MYQGGTETNHTLETDMTRGTFIENEVAYNRAIDRNIRQNANVTRRKSWMDTAEGKRANDFLFDGGEFEATYDADGRFVALHPVVKASLGDFYSAMRENVLEWGGLTVAQNRAVMGMIARAEARVAGFAAKRAAEAAASGWIGTVGERRDFTLTIRTVMELDGQYGISYLHIMKDADGNVVVYKGTKCLGERDDRVTVKATVKEHGERDGVKQTKIARSQ
jgi:hypothetical protein